ncbi:MAG: methyltransferase domain-containing protein [Caldilineaceae bacterium]
MFNFFNNTLFFGLGSALGSQVSLRVGCLTQPRPMPHQFAKALDHPLRMKYRDPLETLGPFGFAPGMTVLDLGCGTGTFTEEMARLVGETGIVHAVDLQQPLVVQTQSRLTAANLAERVHFHCCGAYQLPLPDDSVDLAVLIATLPQIPNKLLALAELSRVLKSGGRLAISEELPDPAYVPPNVTRQWLTEAGFHFGGQTGTFFCYSQIFFNEK